MSNHIFKPMVRYADITNETYEPYKENVDERIIKNTSDIDANKSDIAVNKSDMTDNAVLSRSQAIRATINTLKELFSLGRCRYENIKVKAAFNDIMKELCIK